MFNFSPTAKKLMLFSVIVSAVFFCVFVYFTPNALAFFKGIAFGTCFTVLKIALMERTISRSIDMQTKNAALYAQMNFMFRYFLTAAVLVVSALTPSINMFGTILGLISMQFAAYIMNFVSKNHTRKE